MKKKLCLTFLSGFILLLSYSQDKNETIKQTASNAVNPIASVIKFQLQPNYYIFYNGGNQLNLTTRIICPYDGILLPFIKSGNKKLFSMVRLEVPVTSQTYGSEPELNATGLADITLSDVLAVKTSWGRFGLGPCFGFPSATSPVLGSGKWTAGLVGVIMYTKTKDLLLGLVMNQYFSYAGTPSEPQKNYMTLQPFFNVIIKNGYFIMINPICTLDWTENHYTIPLALGLGKAFAKNLTAFIMPEYILTGPTSKSFVIQFNLNTMF
jgi:hypothetical protein